MPVAELLARPAPTLHSPSVHGKKSSNFLQVPEIESPRWLPIGQEKRLHSSFRPKSVPASPSMPRTLLSSMRVQISSAWQGSSTTKAKVGTKVFWTRRWWNSCRWRTRRSGAAITASPPRVLPKQSNQVVFRKTGNPMKILCRRILLKLPAAKVECLRRRSEGFRHRSAISGITHDCQSRVEKSLTQSKIHHCNALHISDPEETQQPAFQFCRLTGTSFSRQSSQSSNLTRKLSRFGPQARFRLQAIEIHSLRYVEAKPFPGPGSLGLPALWVLPPLLYHYTRSVATCNQYTSNQ